MRLVRGLGLRAGGCHPDRDPGELQTAANKTVALSRRRAPAPDGKTRCALRGRGKIRFYGRYPKPNGAFRKMRSARL